MSRNTVYNKLFTSVSSNTIPLPGTHTFGGQTTSPDGVLDGFETKLTSAKK